MNLYFVISISDEVIETPETDLSVVKVLSAISLSVTIIRIVFGLIVFACCIRVSIA